MKRYTEKLQTINPLTHEPYGTFCGLFAGFQGFQPCKLWPPKLRRA